MCYRVVERYSVCRCLYYQHAIDPCAAHGQPGHSFQEKTVLVGHECSSHSSHVQTKSPIREPKATGLLSTKSLPLAKGLQFSKSKTDFNLKRKASGLCFSYTISQDDTVDSKTRMKRICSKALGKDSEKPTPPNSMKQMAPKAAAAPMSPEPKDLRPIVKHPIPRKKNTKSRRGCLNCTKRRIVCNERRPECNHCTRVGLKCEYPIRTTSKPFLPGPRLPSGRRQVPDLQSLSKDHAPNLTDLASPAGNLQFVAPSLPPPSSHFLSEQESQQLISSARESQARREGEKQRLNHSPSSTSIQQSSVLPASPGSDISDVQQFEHQHRIRRAISSSLMQDGLGPARPRHESVPNNLIPKPNIQPQRRQLSVTRVEKPQSAKDKPLTPRIPRLLEHEPLFSVSSSKTPIPPKPSSKFFKLASDFAQRPR